MYDRLDKRIKKQKEQPTDIDLMNKAYVKAVFVIKVLAFLLGAAAAYIVLFNG